MKEKIFIWGAGRQGHVVLDILHQNDHYEIVGFLDSNSKLTGQIIAGLKVLGDRRMLTRLKKQNVAAGIVAIGNNQDRSQIAEMLRNNNFKLINAIHPSATITSHVKLGSNVTIAAGAIVGTYTRIHNDALINTGAIIEHDNVIKQGAHIASGAKLAGQVIIGKQTFIGIGAAVIQEITIGDHSIIGAGAIVINNLPPKIVAVGIPAKIIKKVTANETASI